MTKTRPIRIQQSHELKRKKNQWRNECTNVFTIRQKGNKIMESKRFKKRTWDFLFYKTVALQSKQLCGFNSFSAIIFLQESPSLQKQDKIQHSELRVLRETSQWHKHIFLSFYHRRTEWFILSTFIKHPEEVWQTFLKRTKKNNVCLHLHALFLNSIWETFPSDTRMIQNIPGLWACTGRFIIILIIIIQLLFLILFTGQTVMSCDRTIDTQSLD